MNIKIPFFTRAKILVVGDVMLDQYWLGDVSRISPEAPVPVVHVQQTEERVGGAGNVAVNISTLGAAVKLLGIVGNDAAAEIIENNLAKHHVKSCLLRVADAPTISKLRVIGHNQQLIRLDFEKRFTTWQEEAFFTAYLSELAACDLVIFSDYGKGTLQHSAKMIAHARRMQKMVLVDPKSKDFNLYRGATIITPNLAEFEMVVGHCQNEDEIIDKAQHLLKQYEFQTILVTRGARGMSIISIDQPALHLPAEACEVYDVTGAGDTVVATLGVALASGANLLEAVTLANLAAGEVVKKLGTAAVSLAELRRAAQKQKIFSDAILNEEQLLQRVTDARASGEKIVMTNGCFDLLHAGHVTYLEQAKTLGQRLIVAVNDDASVARLKGAGRPINQVADRMSVLAALGAVDWVVPFAENTPERLIQAVSPDVLVKGGDYKQHEIAGAQHVLKTGGRVEIIPLVKGLSTTATMAKMKFI